MKRLLVFVAIVVASVTLTHTQTPVDVPIDVAAGRHPIDARIYGVAHADAATLSGLKIPVHRWGGNVSTTHNWNANASNRAADWYFESIADGPAVAGDAADAFVNTSKTNGADTIMTIPALGWVAKVGASRQNLAAFSIAKYGAQTGADTQFFPDAGNGISAATGQAITGNDPNDAYVSSNPTVQRGFAQHLVTRWGNASGGGVKYYAIDNEPSIWHSTHRDIHPTGASMDEVYNDVVAYGAQIKAVDPAAQILAPEEWGWSGYFYSGKDQQWGGANGWANLPDRTAHGGADYLPWFLSQMRQRDASAGLRLLDVFTVHYYPQGGQYSNDTSTTMQQLRNRSTRALWDPSYVDESWIGAQVQLIPRLKNWVGTNYPGTKIGITEYNWGAENHINGATTQADILGIFGREGLDMATYWTFPAPSTFSYKAFKLYRNYDGAGASFGDTSVSAVAPNPDSLSVFAAQRSSDRALTIMAINKDLSVSPTVNFRVSNATFSGPMQVWRLSSTNTITRLADVSVAGTTLTATLPAQTVTLFVVPTQATTATPPAAPTNLRIVNGTGSLTATAGTPQSATVNTAFSTPLKAVLRAGNGATVVGGTVTFTAPASGASAVFGGSAVVTTDANGVATAPTLTANGTAGTYTVVASGQGLSASFTLTNVGTITGNGTWVNVTPSNVDLVNDLDCGNYGTQTVVADPARPSDLYAQFNCQGIWKSTNYGQTWTGPINTGSGGAGAKGAGGIAIAPGPTGQPPILYSAGIRGTGMGFWKSTDGGVSWTNFNVAPGGARQDFYPPVVDPRNPNHVLMAGHEMNLVVQSTNGGATWTSVPIAAGMNQSGGTASLFFIDTGVAATTATTWLYMAQQSGGGIGTWRTANGGGTWTKVDNNEHPHGDGQIYQPDASGVVYMAGAYSALGWGVLRSTNYGQTWTHVGTATPEAVVFGTPNAVYAQQAWACGRCTVATNAQNAPQPGTGTWVSAPTPSAMAQGAAQTAVVFNGTKYVVVSANWLSGLWRYVE